LKWRGSVNFGSPFVASGLIANSYGALIGSKTSGYELDVEKKRESFQLGKITINLDKFRKWGSFIEAEIISALQKIGYKKGRYY
jgi:hypothetical protein